MKFGKNDEAVSPVIGVILMVAITVILAAVIAAFVFGMGAPTKAPQTSLTITADNSTGLKFYHSGGDPLVTTNERISIYDATNNKIMVTNISGVDFTWNSVPLNIVLNGNNTLTPGMTLTNSSALFPKSGILDIKILDIPSGQFIASTRVSVV